MLTVIIVILRRDARGDSLSYGPGCDSSNFHCGLVHIREASLGGRKEEKGGRTSVLDEVTETLSPILESILPLGSLLGDAIRLLFRMFSVRLLCSWRPGICPGAPWVVCLPGPTGVLAVGYLRAAPENLL